MNRNIHAASAGNSFIYANGIQNLEAINSSAGKIPVAYPNMPLGRSGRMS